MSPHFSMGEVVESGGIKTGRLPLRFSVFYSVLLFTYIFIYIHLYLLWDGIGWMLGLDVLMVFFVFSRCSRVLDVVYWRQARYFGFLFSFRICFFPSQPRNWLRTAL